jgi:fibrillarin-like pre-rRNA processing protein
LVVETVDFLYQDISQRNQVEIFLKNMNTYRVSNAIIMTKTRSIDVSSPPSKVIETVKNEIGRHYDIQQILKLNPYKKDHSAIIVG